MKISILVLVIMVQSILFSQKVKKEYYDYYKTQLMAEYQVNSVGEKHGWFKGYDQAGVLVFEYNFKNNLWNGVNKDYSTAYGPRSLSQLETYKMGVLDGPAKYYSYSTTSGKHYIRGEGNFLNGEKNGKWTYIIPDNDYYYHKDKGAEFIKYSKTHENDEVSYYTDGEHKSYYYPSGKICSIHNYKGRQQVGKQITYNPDGTILEEEYFKTESDLIKEKADLLKQNKITDSLNKIKDSIHKAYTNYANIAITEYKFQEAASYFNKVGEQKFENDMLIFQKVKNMRSENKHREALVEIRKVTLEYDKLLIVKYIKEISDEYIEILNKKIDNCSNDLDQKNIENITQEIKLVENELYSGNGKILIDKANKVYNSIPANKITASELEKEFNKLIKDFNSNSKLSVFKDSLKEAENKITNSSSLTDHKLALELLKNTIKNIEQNIENCEKLNKDFKAYQKEIESKKEVREIIKTAISDPSSKFIQSNYYSTKEIYFTEIKAIADKTEKNYYSCKKMNDDFEIIEKEFKKHNLYDFAIIVMEKQIENFKKLTESSQKQIELDKIIASILKLNQYTKEEIKAKKKELKKVEDASIIKALLGI